MRCCSWFLTGLMLIKLSLGSVMAMPISMDGQNPLQTAWSTADQDTAAGEKTKDPQFAGNTPALVAVWPECHEHSANPSDKQAIDQTLASTETNKPCTSDVHCHDCCALGLIDWTVLALHPAPATRPVPEQHGWQSAHVRTVLRPPIA
jgi:hypothetical protein